MRRKLLIFSLTSTILLLLGSVWLVNHSQTQTKLVKKLLFDYSKDLEGSMSVSSIKYTFPYQIELNGFLIRDIHLDTTLFIEKAKLRLNYLYPKKITFLHSAYIQGLDCRIIKLKGDTTFSIQSIFRSSESVGKQNVVPIKINQLVLKESKFRLHDFNHSAKNKEEFDPNHLIFDDINAKIEKCRIYGDSILAQIKELRTKHAGRLDVKKFETKHFVLSPSTLKFEKTKMEFNRSKIFGNITFDQNSFQDFSEFFSAVHTNVQLQNSLIYSQDLNYFFPAFSENNWFIKIHKIDAKGAVDNLKIYHSDVSIGGKNKLKGKLKLRGLPNIQNTFIQADIKDAQFNLAELKQMFDLENVPESELSYSNIFFKGSCTGFYNQMVANGTWESNFGLLKSDVQFDFRQKLPSYSGNFEAVNLDLSKLYKQNFFGTTSFKLNINGQGFSTTELKSQINGKLSEFTVNNYVYKNIEVNGVVADKKFQGDFRILDSNLSLFFSGLANFQKEETQFDFKANLSQVNLKKIGIKSPIDKASAEVDFELFGNNVDNLYGLIHFRQIKLGKDDSTVHFKNLAILSEFDSEKRNIRLESDLVNINIEGSFAPSNLKNSLAQMINTLVSDSTYMPNARKDDFVLDINYQLNQPTIWSHLFDLPFTIGSGKGYFHYRPNWKYLDANFNFSTFQFEAYQIEQPTFSINEDDDMHVFILNHKMIKQNNYVLSDYGQIRCTQAPNGDFAYSLSQKNEEKKVTLFTRGKLFLPSIDTFQVEQELFQMKVSQENWALLEPCRFTVIDKQVKLSPFILSNDNQKILLSAQSDKDQQEISLEFIDVKLNSIDAILNDSIKVSGLTNGNIKLENIQNKFQTRGSLVIKDLVVYNDSLGDLQLSMANMNQQSQINIHSELLNDGVNIMTSDGFYNYETKQIDYVLNTKNFPARLLQPFLDGSLNSLDGDMAISAHCYGPIKKAQYTIMVDFHDTKFTVDYTNVPYKINGEVELNSSEIRLNYFTISDKKNSMTNCIGSITHNNFSDFYLNMQLEDLQNFHVLNTNQTSQELFYGKAYLDGSVNIVGPVEDIRVIIEAKTRKSTHIYLPLGKKSQNKIASYIQFGHPKSQKDSTKNKLNKSQNFEIEMELDITKDASFTLLFDKNQGDSMYAKAKGDIKIKADEQSNLSVFGKLDVEEGIYRFSSYDIIKKDFKIDPSSSITFDGNPFRAKIDMLAVKRESTSPKPLFIEESTYIGNIPVDVMLKIRGFLDAFDVQFDLSYPTLNMQSQSTDLINVLDELTVYPEEIKRQAVALLVLGTFIPPLYKQNPSESIRLSSAVNNSLGEFISSQASKLFGQINPKWDFNINYNAENQVAQREVILSVKRKFLRDRLALGGSYDAANSKNSTYKINLQYDITKDGNVKFVGFNKQANDPNIGMEQNMNTTGVGILFRKSFDKFIQRKSVKLEAH